MMVSEGDFAAVIRHQFHFLGAGGIAPPNHVEAVYDWYYWNDDSGEISVAANWSQDIPHVWREIHFLEAHLDDKLTEIAHADGKRTLEKTGEVFRYPHWGALTDKKSSIAFLGNKTQIHDAEAGAYSYLMLDPDFAWSGWKSRTCSNFGTIRLMDYSSAMAEQLNSYQPRSMETARLSAPALEKQVSTWLEAAALALRMSGDLTAEEAKTLADFPDFFSCETENLAFLFHRLKMEDGTGLVLAAMVDKKTLHVRTGTGNAPLFTLINQDANGGLSEYSSLNPWEAVTEKTDENGLILTFIPKADSGICTVEVRFSPAVNGGTALNYALSGGDPSKAVPKSLTTLTLSATSPGSSPRFVWPEGPGKLFTRPFDTPFYYTPIYPDGFPAPMQWSAMWDDETGEGLYTAFHDRLGWYKRLIAHCIPEKRVIELSYRVEIPADLSFPADPVIIAPFTGSWYDAAQIYRSWVKTAAWYPQIDPQSGRTDTPDWLKKLPLWLLYNYTTKEETVSLLKKAQEAFGVPIGVHVYNWHGNPFDNDYPHYFPTKPEFSDAVLELQKEGNIHIMPYINGRLWDIHDSGLEDKWFTNTALPFAVKKENGSPETEKYGSLEADGTPVELAIMCPATDLWRNKVRENVLRIMNEIGTDAVYIDQVAAAVPALCMDPSHGHPVNGGAWWTESYRSLFSRIRADMRENTCRDYPLAELVTAARSARSWNASNQIVTTECNAEPYMSGFDGYLTWHWQMNQSVPLYSTVYSDAVRLFGRSYAGGADARKMKAAESLVYAEQIGWFEPETISWKEVMDFVRPLVRFRYFAADYFYRGQTVRPPKMLDEIPAMSADWLWAGQPTPVTTPAVRTGTQRLLDGTGALLIFTNPSTEPVQSRISVSLEELGFNPDSVRLRRVDSEGNRSENLPVSILSDPITFPPLETWGFEIIPQ